MATVNNVDVDVEVGTSFAMGAASSSIKSEKMPLTAEMTATPPMYTYASVSNAALVMAAPQILAAPHAAAEIDALAAEVRRLQWREYELSAALQEARDDVKAGKKGCCRNFWRPLGAEYWRAFFYNTFVALPLATFAFGWTISMFTTTLACIIVFPVSVAFAYITAWSSRVLARLELATVSILRADITSSPIYAPPILPAVPATAAPMAHQSCASASVVHFRAMLSSGHSWAAFVYFFLLKFPLALVAFVLTLVLPPVGLALMFNWIFLLTCPGYSCFMIENGNGSSSGSAAWDGPWILTDPVSAVVAVPVGICVLIVGMYITVFLGRFQRVLAVACLATQPPTFFPLDAPAVVRATDVKN